MKYKKNLIIVLIGLGSLVLGYSYAHELYGVLESEVEQWGYFSELLGMVLLVLIPNQGKFMNFILYVCSLIQIPPIILWFIFHGSFITDFTYSNQFVAHWAFSIPHITLLILCLYVLKLIRRNYGT